MTQTSFPALAPRSQAIEVRERLDAFGGTVLPLSQNEVERVVELIRTAAPQSVAISLVFSYVNDHHEANLAQAIRSALVELAVYVSSEINPESGEYARTNTTSPQPMSVWSSITIWRRSKKGWSAPAFRPL